MNYNEQWPQRVIEDLISNARDRAKLLITAVHARDYVLSQKDGFSHNINAAELLMDGIQNALDPSTTGLEWWTLRHRLNCRDLQRDEWQDAIKTTWITARESEWARDGKQR